VFVREGAVEALGKIGTPKALEAVSDYKTKK
jgi:HEAT repeat protein